MKSGSYNYPGVYSLPPAQPAVAFVTGTVYTTDSGQVSASQSGSITPRAVMFLQPQPVFLTSPIVLSASNVSMTSSQTASFGGIAQPVYIVNPNYTGSDSNVEMITGSVTVSNTVFVAQDHAFDPWHVVVATGSAPLQVIVVSGSSGASSSHSSVQVSGTMPVLVENVVSASLVGDISATILNPTTSVTASIVGTVPVQVQNQISSVSASIVGVVPVTGTVYVANQISTVAISNPVTSVSATVTNPTTVVTASIANPVTSVTASLIGVMSASLTDGSKATYSAASVGLALSGITGTTDLFTIAGSATKTIRITRICLTATQTTATQRDVLLIKRSTANRGGTSAAVTAVPHDSASPAATATVTSYSANPTALGTAVGTVKARKVYIGTTTANSDECVWDFGLGPNQAIVLRGTSQILAVNLNSVISSGGSVDINVQWTEE